MPKENKHDKWDFNVSWYPSATMQLWDAVQQLDTADKVKAYLEGCIAPMLAINSRAQVKTQWSRTLDHYNSNPELMTVSLAVWRKLVYEVADTIDPQRTPPGS